MTLWNWINGNPPYAEEKIINQEVEQIQERLSQFKQLVPEGFTELGQPKKYWGSTEGWKEPVCERYSFKYKGKSITLDISKELNDGLELGLKDNFCIDEKILPSHLPEEGIVTIKSEKEIFLRKTFTVDNLEKDINVLLKNIGEQKEKNNQLTTELKVLQNTITEWRNQTEILKRELEEKKNEIERLKSELEKEKGWWKKWIDDKDDIARYFHKDKGVNLRTGVESQLTRWKNKPLGELLLQKIKPHLKTNLPTTFDIRLEVSLLEHDPFFQYHRKYADYIDSKTELLIFKSIIKYIQEYYKNK